MLRAILLPLQGRALEQTLPSSAFLFMEDLSTLLYTELVMEVSLSEMS